MTEKKKKKKLNKSQITILVIALCGVAYLFVFKYLPMFGVLLAFKDGDYKIDILDTIVSGEWVGFKHFKNFLFYDDNFADILLNTLGLNLLQLLINFPAPIIFAVLINEFKNKKYRAAIQSMANFPHFISWVIFGGLVIALTDMNTGVINPILEFLGLSSENDPVNLGAAQYFWAEMIITSLLKGVGWGSIVYSAAISGISHEIYDAATIDGAGRFAKAVKITIPMIAGTVTVFLLLNISNLLSNSFEQFYVLQNSLNLERSEVLSTYIYKKGISQRRYSYTSAIGLFESLVSFLLLLSGNFISKKLTGRGIY